MPEEEIRPKISRRDFTKGAGAAVVYRALRGLVPEDVSLKPERSENLVPSRPGGPEDQEQKERLSPKEFSIAAVSTPPELLQIDDEIQVGYEFLWSIGKVLKDESVNLVVTPERSFEMLREGYYKRGAQFPPEKLLLTKEEKDFSVHQGSSDIVIDIVSQAQELAKKYRCDLFLATFYEIGMEDGKYYPTLLRINPEGKIVGRKRKFQPPEGSFTLKIGQRELRVLPLICGEALRKVKDSQTGEGKIVVPDWVKDGAPYDILTHSLAEEDLDFTKLASFIQRTQQRERKI